MAYDNTNRGTLGKNERREKDTHPEYTGALNVDGTEYWLSAWVKEGPKGKFFSLSVKPKQPDRHHGGSTVEEREPGQDDGEIPF